MSKWLLLLLLLSGCSTTPYAEAFIGYRVGNQSFESCSNENAGIRLGVEKQFTKHIIGKLEYEHISHLLCGRPFNNQPEAYADHVGVVIRYE